MTRRLLPLLLALLLCTACGGKSKPPTTTAPPTASPTTAPSPMPTATPAPLSFDQQLAAHLTCDAGAERLGDPARLSALVSLLKAEFTFDSLANVATRATRGDYAALGWTATEQYVLDCSRQPDIIDKRYEPVTQITAVYWPEGGVWHFTTNVGYYKALLVSADPPMTTLKRLLSQMGRGAALLENSQERFAFFDTVRQLAATLDSGAPPSWDLACAELLPDIHGGDTQRWTFLLSSADGQPLSAYQATGQTLTLVPRDRYFQRPTLPTQGRRGSLHAVDGLPDADSRTVYFPTDGGFLYVDGTTLRFINASTGKVSVVTDRLPQPTLHDQSQDNGSTDAAPLLSYRSVGVNLLVYSQTGARLVSPTGRLLNSVDIPLDDYLRQLTYRSGFDCDYSDDLTLTALHSDRGYTLFFDNNTHRQLTTIDSDALAFERGSTRVSGTTLWPLRQRDAENSDAPRQKAWVSFDPTGTAPPSAQLLPDELIDYQAVDGKTPANTYAMPLWRHRPVYEPAAPVEFTQYTRGAAVKEYSFTADPFSGKPYTVRLSDYSGELLLFGATQHSDSSQSCHLLLRAGQPKAQPVVYFNTATTRALAMTADGALLLAVDSPYTNELAYFTVSR